MNPSTDVGSGEGKTETTPTEGQTVLQGGESNRSRQAGAGELEHLRKAAVPRDFPVPNIDIFENGCVTYRAYFWEADSIIKNMRWPE